MAAVEDLAGPTGIEAGLTSTETDDMKNTARKSTSKPAQRNEKLSPSSPSSVVNGVMDGKVDRRPVANGNGTHKRCVEEQEQGNPAKVARLHIEDLERAQEEMTRKISREEDMLVVKNGEVTGEDSNMSQGDKSNDSTSKHSSLSRTSLALSADAKSNFKGILDVAMTKVGSRRSSYTGSDCAPCERSSSPEPQGNCPDQSTKEADLSKQENGESNKDDDSKNHSSTEDIPASDGIEQHKTSDSKNDTESTSHIHDALTLANCKDTVKDDNMAAEDQSAVNDITSDAEGVKESLSTPKGVEKGDLGTDGKLDEDLLQGEEDEDHSGDVDDAVLLSDDDKSEDKVNKKSELNSSLPEKSHVDVDKIADDKVAETSDGKSSDKPDINGKGGEVALEQSAGQDNVEEKSLESSQNDQDTGKDSSELNTGEDNAQITKDETPGGSNSEKETIDGEAATSKAKAFDIPEDKIISLSDDDDDVEINVKSSKKIDCDANSPIEIEDDEDNKSDLSDASSTRKRGAASPIPSNNSSTKKSRLDKVIGRLGSAIGIKPSDAVVNTDVDTAGVTEEKPTEDTAAAEEKMDVQPEEESKKEVQDIDKDTTKDDKSDLKPEVKSDVATESKQDDKSEVKSAISADNADANPDVKPDVKPVKSSLSSSEKTLITLTAEELNKLLISRMNAYLERSRGSLIVQLENRISELQSAVSSWRDQAKRLAKQLDEEVKNNQRRQGKMVRRRAVTDDGGGKVSQLQAASLQQQGGGGGKVTVRPGPRTPPRAPGTVPAPQGLVPNPASAKVGGPNPVPIRLTAAQAAAQAKGTTVRDLLDKQRGTEAGPPKSQAVQIQGGRILVASRNSLVAGTRPPSTSGRAVTSHPPPGGSTKGVIDLTDDDDRKAEAGGGVPKQTMRLTSGQQVTLRNPAAAGGATARPGAVLVQQLPNSPVIVQQVVSSQALRPAAGGTTYVYTQTRPGPVTVQAAPGSSIVRPAMMTTSAPPALRPASQVVAVTRAAAPAGALTRPPPPLRVAPNVVSTQGKHPAPLPSPPEQQSTQAKKPPPKPGLKISRVQSGIVLSWNMTVSDQAAQIASYQLFAYQETSAAPNTNLWKKVGDVKALPLPMACTLTQFQEGNKYHFAVRAVDVHSRVGPFSDPSSIALTVINVS